MNTRFEGAFLRPFRVKFFPNLLFASRPPRPSRYPKIFDKIIFISKLQFLGQILNVNNVYFSQIKFKLQVSWKALTGWSLKVLE